MQHRTWISHYPDARCNPRTWISRYPYGTWNTRTWMSRCPDAKCNPRTWICCYPYATWNTRTWISHCPGARHNPKTWISRYPHARCNTQTSISHYPDARCNTLTWISHSLDARCSKTCASEFDHTNSSTENYKFEAKWWQLLLAYQVKAAATFVITASITLDKLPRGHCLVPSWEIYPFCEVWKKPWRSHQSNPLGLPSSIELVIKLLSKKKIDLIVIDMKLHQQTSKPPVCSVSRIGFENYSAKRKKERKISLRV